MVEARCPTFHWAGVPGAGGYELAVFQLPEHDAPDGAEPVLITRASVPGDARGFTPSSPDCLERGRRYAWSIAVKSTAAGDAAGELAWSRPFLFEVGAAPSLEEVEQAIATLERYREHLPRDAPAPAAAVSAGAAAPAADVPAARVTPITRQPRTAFAPGSPLPGPLTAPTSGVVRVPSAAALSLGTPSLRVSANVALGTASNLFKNNQVFLWDDVDGNTALGRNALASGNYATSNTAVGRDALRFTAGGQLFSYGSQNTAVGDGALRTNYYGYRNTATGFHALYSNTSGSSNTASGYRALASNTTGSFNTVSGFVALANGTGHFNTASGYAALISNSGSRNTAIGTLAGFNATSGSDNIFVGSGAAGVSGETNTIRIGGTATGTGIGQQNRTFINGIHGTTTANAAATAVLIDSAGRLVTASSQNLTFINGVRGIQTYYGDAVPVLIDGAGQLGTDSSSRSVKQDISDLGAVADRLLELRPVAFRYRKHAAANPETPLQFGLIAEEVAEVFPELVVFDQEGRPETVKYHLLSGLLLGALQKQRDALEEQRGSSRRQQEELARQRELAARQHAEVQRLAARVEALESRSRR